VERAGLERGRVAEPLVLHSPSPALLAGAWSVLRETLLVGQVPRGLKESVASTVSAINRCPYCVDVHTMLARAAGYRDAASAVDDVDAGGGFDDRQLATLPRAGGPRLPEVLRWAAATRSPGAEILRTPPFTAREAPEIIGVAVTFHYINRIVSATLPETLFGARPGLQRVACDVGLCTTPQEMSRGRTARVLRVLCLA
jgi:AhpD family alkylhydroperoxidase